MGGQVIGERGELGAQVGAVLCRGG